MQQQVTGWKQRAETAERLLEHASARVVGLERDLGEAVGQRDSWQEISRVLQERVDQAENPRPPATISLGGDAG